MIARSLQQGFALATRRFRITAALYVFNLTASLLVALPMAALLHDALGRSLAAEGLEARFRLETLLDLLAARRDEIGVLFGVTGLAALVYALLSAVLTGGLVDTLRSPPRSPFLPRFLGGAGRLAFRYLRLLPYLALALLAVAAIGRGLDHLVLIVFDQSTHEVAAFWAMRARQAVVLGLLLGTAATFDLARILTALEDRTHMIGALLTALGFVARHLLGVMALVTALSLLGLAVLVPYLLTAHHVLDDGSFVALVVAQQIVVLFRHWIRVAGFAALLSCYRQVTGAAPAPSPAGAEEETPSPAADGGGIARRLLPAGTVTVVLLAAALTAPFATAPMMKSAGATTTPAPLTATGTGPVVVAPADAGAPGPEASSVASRAGGVSGGRVVSYRIEASLDPSRHAVTGREWIEYRNTTRRTMTDLMLHLYMNAFSNDRTTYMRGIPWDDDAARRRLRRLAEVGGWGSIHVTALRVDGVDLTTAARVDGTILSVALPSPVPPGRATRLEIAWETLMPRTFHRTGRWGEHYDVMQWYPKPAVWTDAGWKVYPFSRYTEFFADYGTFDVSLTVPAGFRVEATGVPAAPRDNPDGTRTLAYRALDVHDFAWIADPNAEVARVVVADGPYAASPVEVIYFHQPAHRGMARRVLEAARHGLLYYGERFLPYPYPRVVIDDLPMGLSSGMEYPMLFTVSLAWFVPEFHAGPEELTLHEFGHQYWYGLVGTNEFEEAWLDEGVNSYVTRRALETLRPAPRGRTINALFHYAAWRVLDEGLEMRLPGVTLDLDRLLGFHATPFKPQDDGFIGYPLAPLDLRLPGFHDGGLQAARADYREVARDDPMTTPSWGFLPGSYYGTVYDKTHVVLETFARLIGAERLDAALREYARRHRFAHPTATEFLAVLRAAVAGAGPDVDPDLWIDALVRGTGTVDYAVTALTSRPLAPARGLLPADRAGIEPLDRRFPDAPAQPGEEQFETEVIVRRLGDAVLPVDILVRFEDGGEFRERWDGRASWWRRTWERPARARSAEVDPDGILAVDLDRTNNGRRLHADPWPVLRLSLQWLFWVQNYLHLAVCLV